MPVGDLRIKVSVFGAGQVVAGLEVGVFLVVLVWVDRGLRGGVEGGRFENFECPVGSGVSGDASAERLNERCLNLLALDDGRGALDGVLVLVVAPPHFPFVLAARVPGLELVNLYLVINLTGYRDSRLDPPASVVLPTPGHA